MSFCKHLLGLASWLLPFCALAETSSLQDVSWPEISKERAGDPLVLQLAISSTELAYGRPFDFYVRFVNQGKKAIEIPLINHDIDEETLLRTSLGDGRQAYPDIGGCPCVVLGPNETLILKIPDQYAWLGGFRNKVSYRDPRRGREIHSNVISYSCVRKPFSEKEMAECNQRLEQAIASLASADYAGKDYYGLENLPAAVKIVMVANKSCPYSLPALKKHLVENPDAKVRYVMLLCLQFLGGKNDAAEMGFVYDLSSADLLLRQLVEEKHPQVLELLIGTISVYCRSGGLTSEQRVELQARLMPLLDSASPMVRVSAASLFLDAFPGQYGLIEERLGKKDFYLPAYENGIWQLVRAIKSKRQQK